MRLRLARARLAALALLLVGCGAGIDQARFEKIQAEMTVGDVNAILGEPSETRSMTIGPLSGTLSTWKGAKGTITVQFANGRVKAKQFVRD